MADETPAVPSATPAEQPTQQAPEAPIATLDDIAKEFSIDEQATTFSARPQPTPPPQSPAPQQPAPPYQPQIPDPVLDSEGYRAYMANQAVLNAQLHGTLSTLNQRLETWERTQQQAKVDADVQKAVSKVNEKLKVDPQLAEIALEKLYRNDASFKRIWDNRDKNPQAYERALGVVADKLAPLFSVRQDPQLTENRRAATQSQRTMATTAKQNIPPGQEDLYNAASSADFDRAWETIKRGGGY